MSTTSSNLTVDCFKRILQEEYERSCEQQKVKEESKLLVQKQQLYEKQFNSVQTVLRHFGIVVSDNDDARVEPNNNNNNNAKYWTRPLISDDLYRCPISSPQTTLVDWYSLPKPIQTKLLESNWINPTSRERIVQYQEDKNVTRKRMEECLIVEVPASYNSVDPETSTSTTSSSIRSRQRPIRGNLTDKLSEYTRGISGIKNNPFRPGGLNPDDTPDHTNVNPDMYRTDEAVQRAIAVLDKGTEQAWMDGTILTAPPGVDFMVGLSWDDVYGTPNQTQADMKNLDEPIDFFERMEDGNFNQNTFSSTTGTMTTETIGSTFVPIATTATKGMFTRSYFDDDSLFGSSSGSDDDGNDDDIELETEDMTKESADDAHKTDTSYIIASESEKELRDETNNIPLDGQEIDNLLQELTIQDSSTILNRKVGFHKETSTNALGNPLTLMENQIRNQQNNTSTDTSTNTNTNTNTNTTRKTWATTSLLPIIDYNTLLPNPALKFPFQLDDFQQQAVARLERSESVFVAAHTSAGKTVVAEYAVALAMQRSTRCVYTSPIKALSNQKFRDFCLKFGSNNVGLITGDIQVNVDDATCLIMTTEILRSMLYRGADLIRDVDSVIFDEVHYINDSERGVVWEEVIIMLPSYVNLIFLSATTPNTLEFSDWIGRTKRKPVHVITTSYRPVPLSHHLWAGTKLHKILEGRGKFIDVGYASAIDALLPQSAKDPAKKKVGDQKGRPATGTAELAWQAQGGKQNWMSLIRFLDKEFLTPTVVFSFSKKRCEEIAGMLISLDLNTSKERSAVMSFTLQTISRLSENDSKLPQVLTICEMVQRGIGVHHGGLLPILKEMVEILFSRNLIKVLFATETFAMGVNMPAKAVVFQSIRKHDGTQFRVLEPGEYTQMAGRAGRRGLDTVGTVIICCFGECPPPQPMLRQMLTGASTKLSSQFRLTYNMILNLLKVEEMSVEAMIKRSFSEFATQRALTANNYPQLLARGSRALKKLEQQFEDDAGSRIGAEDLEEYFYVCNRLLQFNYEVFSYIMQNDSAVFDDMFQPGKVLYVTACRQLGAVCSPAFILQAPNNYSALQADAAKVKMICLILLPPSYVESTTPTERSKPGTIGYVGLSRQRNYLIAEVELTQIILLLGAKRRAIDTKLLLKTNEKSMAIDAQWAGFTAVGQKKNDPFAGMVALGRKGDTSGSNPRVKEEQELDVVVGYLIETERSELSQPDMIVHELHSYVKRGNQAVHIREVCDQIQNLIGLMRSFKAHRHPTLAKYYETIEKKETLRIKVETLRHLLSNESLQLFPDFLQRKAVLRKLGYVNENDIIGLKGRVACEVNTCEELVATEMVFEGLLNDLEPEEIAAVLSALVYQEKSKDEEFDSELPKKIVNCCLRLKRTAINLGQLQKEQGLEVDPGEYCDRSLNFGLVHVVYEWALGVPFKSICDLTDAQEGSIVRCITRLDELCREIRNCARVVGNPTLYRKLEIASTSIKRDIVFASSLYVS